MKKLIFGTFTLLYFIFTGCNKDMTIPVYFQIDSVDFAADYTQYGTASHKITDVWVSVNGVGVGVYELPAKFPVLASGQAKIQLSPGIMMNGLSSKRPNYPLYTTYITNLNLEKKQTYRFNPTFTYEKYVQLAFMEDFEDAGIKFEQIENSPSIQKTGDESSLFHYPGEINNYSGIVNITDTNANFFEIHTIESFLYNYTQTKYCFLELNYKYKVSNKNDSTNLEVGIYVKRTTGNTEQCPIIRIKHTDTWKKMYINLTEIINKQGLYLSSFTIYIKGTTQAGGTATFLFDNIKLMYVSI